MHTDVHTDGAYLLLAGGARCVRGRVANCRADPMVASSSAAATDPLLFFAGPGTPPPNSVGFLALYLRRTASGALRSSARQMCGRVRAVKFMWGLFACNELLHRRFGMGDGNCDHCQGEKETAWHVLGQCRHPDAVAARRKLALKMWAVVAGK